MEQCSKKTYIKKQHHAIYIKEHAEKGTLMICYSVEKAVCAKNSRMLNDNSCLVAMGWFVAVRRLMVPLCLWFRRDLLVSFVCKVIVGSEDATIYPIKLGRCDTYLTMSVLCTIFENSSKLSLPSLFPWKQDIYESDMYLIGYERIRNAYPSLSASMMVLSTICCNCWSCLEIWMSTLAGNA